MVRWDVPRTPTSALYLTRQGADHGVPADVCLRGTGLRTEELVDPAFEVSAAQELRIIANLTSALGNPAGLGLDSGTRFRLTAYGIWGFAMLSSPTLRSAIEIGLRFVDLSFAFSEITLRQVGAEAQLVLDTPGVPLELRRFVVEKDTAGIQTIQQDLFTFPIAISRISFVFPVPDVGPGQYEAVFGVVPEFDARENLFVFDEAFLDLPLPQANEYTTALTMAHLSDLLARRRARSGLSGQVRDLVLARLPDTPEADDIAAALHMSSRAMRHHLAAEGATFRGLVDEVRERLAEELLVIGGLSVADIADRLGYLEMSSFSQAFRRWKGVTPSAYRSRNLAR